MLDYFILAQDTIDPPKRKSWNRYCFQLQKLRLGFTRKKKKKKNPFVKHCGWVCAFNYENAIEN